MVDMMKVAKELIISVYGIAPHIADIRKKSNRWDDRYFDDYSIHSGMFRQTLIPDNHMFVIKTGLTVGGNRQCKREMDYYFNARKADLQEYFSKCYGRIKVGAVYFYVYEYINDIGNHDSFHYLNDSDWNEQPFYWMEDEIADRVEDFCDQYDINDLHDGNFGFKNGHAVLTDYSGYWGEDRRGQDSIYKNPWG